MEALKLGRFCVSTILFYLQNETICPLLTNLKLEGYHGQVI